MLFVALLKARPGTLQQRITRRIVRFLPDGMTFSTSPFTRLVQPRKGLSYSSSFHYHNRGWIIRLPKAMWMPTGRKLY